MPKSHSNKLISSLDSERSFCELRFTSRFLRINI